MDEPAAPPDLSSFFEDKPPPTWGSPEWKWGSADGEAHVVAERVREELSKPHRRAAMLSYARMGAVDFFDLKMALALMCQKASNEGFDASDGRWASLVAEMESAAFEDGGMIVQESLAEAVNTRLAQRVENPLDIDGKPNPAGVVAVALEELGFVKRGLV